MECVSSVCISISHTHTLLQTNTHTHGHASDHHNEIKYLYDGQCDVINSKWKLSNIAPFFYVFGFLLLALLCVLLTFFFRRSTFVRQMHKRNIFFALFFLSFLFFFFFIPLTVGMQTRRVFSYVVKMWTERIYVVSDVYTEKKKRRRKMINHEWFVKTRYIVE